MLRLINLNYFKYTKEHSFFVSQCLVTVIINFLMSKSKFAKHIPQMILLDKEPASWHSTYPANIMSVHIPKPPRPHTMFR